MLNKLSETDPISDEALEKVCETNRYLSWISNDPVAYLHRNPLTATAYAQEMFIAYPSIIARLKKAEKERDEMRKVLLEIAEALEKEESTG